MIVQDFFKDVKLGLTSNSKSPDLELVGKTVGKAVVPVKQVCPTLLLPIDCPAQFISNPNQTHLKQQIKVSSG